jgi:surfeit locus 1 family protein
VRLGPFDFRPGLAPSLATLTLLPGLVALGVWQLDRAAEKQALLEVQERNRRLPAVSLPAAASAGAELRYRRLRAAGRYLGERQWLLDNQVRQGRVGYRVFTPFLPEGSDTVVLVDRGWAPAGPRRSDLPSVPAPPGRLEIRGGAHPPPAVALRLEPAEPSQSGWPRVAQYIEPRAVEREIGHPAHPYVLRLDADAPGGLAPGPQSASALGPQRHLGYAVQWFALGVTLVLVYLGANLRRRTGAKGSGRTPER